MLWTLLACKSLTQLSASRWKLEAQIWIKFSCPVCNQSDTLNEWKEEVEWTQTPRSSQGWICYSVAHWSQTILFLSIVLRLPYLISLLFLNKKKEKLIQTRFKAHPFLRLRILVYILYILSPVFFCFINPLIPLSSIIPLPSILQQYLWLLHDSYFTPQAPLSSRYDVRDRSVACNLISNLSITDTTGTLSYQAYTSRHRQTVYALNCGLHGVLGKIIKWFIVIFSPCPYTVGQKSI